MITLGDIAIDEIFDLRARDMAVKTHCVRNTGRRCVAGTSPDGMNVMVWSAAGDELLLAAIAPDVLGLSMPLEEWRTVGGA